tara:strand:- start:1055 stop:1399 length:345 start_codon:yes stop_codon:yes gene_type:complete
MSDFLPVLNAADPTVVPAKTYDRVWIESVIIKAPDPNGEVRGEVKMHKYGMFDKLDEVGNTISVAELDPTGGKWLMIDNMLEEASEDNDLQMAFGALLGYVAKLGVENNVISAG